MRQILNPFFSFFRATTTLPRMTTEQTSPLTDLVALMSDIEDWWVSVNCEKALPRKLQQVYFKIAHK